jgi:hypothetical protein
MLSLRLTHVAPTLVMIFIRVMLVGATIASIMDDVDIV